MNVSEEPRGQVRWEKEGLMATAAHLFTKLLIVLTVVEFLSMNVWEKPKWQVNNGKGISRD